MEGKFTDINQISINKSEKFAMETVLPGNMLCSAFVVPAFAS